MCVLCVNVCVECICASEGVHTCECACVFKVRETIYKVGLSIIALLIISL